MPNSNDSVACSAHPNHFREVETFRCLPSAVCAADATQLVRIPNTDSSSTRRTHRSHCAGLVICSDSRVCGVCVRRDPGYPETYPKKVVAAVGCPRTSLEHRRTKSGLENRIFSGLLDVYGRPWMAPRAGFEIGRKLLSTQMTWKFDRPSTPRDTPTGLALNFERLRRPLGRVQLLKRSASR